MNAPVDLAIALPGDLERLFARQRAAFARDMYPALRRRRIIESRAARALLRVALACALGACATLERGGSGYRVAGDGIPAPLAGLTGDAARGRSLLVARDPANCVLCHSVPDADTAAGNLGPPLAGVGARLTEAQIRLRVVDEQRVFAQSIMPSYYRVEGLANVAPEFRAKPILSAQAVEDVVAYLATLR
jgi:sulfur-oxidizing protein SoxX